LEDIRDECNKYGNVISLCNTSFSTSKETPPIFWKDIKLYILFSVVPFSPYCSFWLLLAEPRSPILYLIFGNKILIGNVFLICLLLKSPVLTLTNGGPRLTTQPKIIKLKKFNKK